MIAMPAICAYCQTELIQNATTCVGCGAPCNGEPTTVVGALPLGTKLLDGKVFVGRVLDRDSLGITYLACDTRQGKAVALREFFPTGCTRWSNMAMPGDELADLAFTEARRRFLTDGAALSKCDSAGLLRVLGTIEENNTGYLVREHIEGDSLASLVRERGGLQEKPTLAAIEMVGQGLELAHQRGLLHRNIRPENLILTKDGRVVLIGFGEGMELPEELGGTKNRTWVDPYTPIDLMWKEADVGVFTDVFGLAATLYYLLGGQEPIPARDRAAGQAMPELRELNPSVSPGVAAAVMQGLEMQSRRRPQSVAQLIALLQEGAAAAAAEPPAPAAPVDDPPGLESEPAYEPADNGGGAIGEDAPASSRYEGLLEGHRGSVACVTFSHQGQLLASGGDDRTLRLWDAATGREKRQLPGHNGPVSCLRFGPDDRVLASGSWDCTVRLWDPATGAAGRVLEGHTSWVRCLAFSPDGGLLASSSDDGSVRIWDVEAGQEVARLDGHEGPVTCVAFSPDTNFLATCSEDRSVKIWDLGGSGESYPLEGHTDWVHAIAFSPDGSLLASASADQTIRLWRVGDRTEEGFLEGHSGPVTALAFHPSGGMLVSGSEDQSIRFWDVARGEELTSLQPHRGAILCISLSPDGGMLATASWDETVRVTRLPDPVALAGQT